MDASTTPEALKNIATEVLKYELTKNPLIQSAKLYMASTDQANQYSFVLSLSGTEQVKSVSKLDKYFVYLIKKGSFNSSSASAFETISQKREGTYFDPSTAEILFRTVSDNELPATNLTLIHEWKEFDHTLRKQLGRWSWLNSPMGYLWGGGVLILPIILLYIVLRMAGCNF